MDTLKAKFGDNIPQTLQWAVNSGVSSTKDFIDKYEKAVA
jgi:hypothetical protein